MFTEWKQTTPYSCGGAALMVAMNELGYPMLSKELEDEIWQFANAGSTVMPGSYPGRLALFAKKKGFEAVILQDAKRIESLLVNLNQTLFGISFDKLLEEHNLYLQEAESEEIQIKRYVSIPLESLKRHLPSNKILIAVMVPQAIQYGLHWILLQDYDLETDMIRVMDPSLGISQDVPFEKLNIQFNQFFIGVAILITK